jgi:hypothetical protein
MGGGQVVSGLATLQIPKSELQGATLKFKKNCKYFNLQFLYQMAGGMIRAFHPANNSANNSHFVRI